MIDTFKQSVQQVLFPFSFIHFQVALSRAWDNSFCLVTGQKDLIILRLENCRTFLHRQPPQGSTSMSEGWVQCLPTWVAGIQQCTVISEPEFPSVTSAHPLCQRLKLPRETTAPQCGLERSKLSHQGTHWGCHCPIAKLMTFGEFGNLLLCGGERDKEIQDEALYK